MGIPIVNVVRVEDEILGGSSVIRLMLISRGEMGMELHDSEVYSIWTTRRAVTYKNIERIYE